MKEIICILGRQPDLGRAELERLCPDMAKFSNTTALVKSDSININELGGTLKVGEIKARLNNADLKSIGDEIVKLLAAINHKFSLGVSFYDTYINPKEVNAFAFEIKKQLRKFSLSVRVVPNHGQTLSTPQVIHNKLAKEPNCEILIATNKNETIIAFTTQVQDIEAYGARDQERPMRDARVGMLPPKLAQIMINLAKPIKNNRLLDPFCGTGVILQEALIKGFNVYGTDINEKMVEYTRTNLRWLETKFSNLPKYDVELADATRHRWIQPIDVIVSELFLGKPLSYQLNKSELNIEINVVDKLLVNFLENLHGQLMPSAKLCLAVPAWKINNGFVSLPSLDHLSKIGYNHISFKTVKVENLLYFRPSQLVARKLLILTRN